MDFLRVPFSNGCSIDFIQWLGSFSFKNLLSLGGSRAVRKPLLPVRGIQNCPNNEKLNSPIQWLVFPTKVGAVCNRTGHLHNPS